MRYRARCNTCFPWLRMGGNILFPLTVSYPIFFQLSAAKLNQWCLPTRFSCRSCGTPPQLLPNVVKSTSIFSKRLRAVWWQNQYNKLHHRSVDCVPPRFLPPPFAKGPTILTTTPKSFIIMANVDPLPYLFDLLSVTRLVLVSSQCCFSTRTCSQRLH